MGKKGNIKDTLVQLGYDADVMNVMDKAKFHPGGETFKKGGKLEAPDVREERKATQAAAKEKIAARGRIKPIPDPETGKAERRKTASRRRQRRGGRASTILSGASETLG